MDFDRTGHETADTRKCAAGVSQRLIQEAIETRVPLADLLRDMWLAHRNTPNSITNIAPFEYMRGRSGAPKCFQHGLKNRLGQEDLDQEKFNKVPDLRENYERKYKLQYDYRYGVSNVKWRVGDMVLVKNPGFRTKGRSSFKGPFRIKEVKRNVVVLDNGDVWSMSRIVKWSNLAEDSSTLENQGRNQPSNGSEASPCTKAPFRIRSKPQCAILDVVAVNATLCHSSKDNREKYSYIGCGWRFLSAILDVVVINAKLCHSSKDNREKYCYID
ncbi:hypothetical protein NDU88_005682 [Pleurodeles waltl]|uniref:Uncharacterized protein n=1 Tax=Pleurodeles waltl TaxID=8319 RepID=A0AAV7SMD2_PLEWA|nr:hypothetical protein NDU88_005682 [Pleurodeles waltl]